MSNFDVVDVGIVECCGNCFDMVDVVLMMDCMVVIV